MAKKSAELEKYKEYYKILQEKKAAIEKAELGRYSSDGLFSYGVGKIPTNIITCTDKYKLKDMYVFLLAREKNDQEASKDLGMEEGEPTWLNTPIKIWKEDIKIRVTKLNLAQAKANANTLESKLMTLSPELLKEVKEAEFEKQLMSL